MRINELALVVYLEKRIMRDSEYHKRVLMLAEQIGDQDLINKAKDFMAMADAFRDMEMIDLAHPSINTTLEITIEEDEKCRCGENIICECGGYDE
jgi:hypothetical protein